MMLHNIIMCMYICKTKYQLSPFWHLQIFCPPVSDNLTCVINLLHKCHAEADFTLTLDPFVCIHCFIFLVKIILFFFDWGMTVENTGKINV